MNSHATVFPAIILKSYETGNTSEMIHIFSGEHGRLSVYAKGHRGPRGRLRGILQPLSLVEISLALREGAETGTLRDATLLSSQEEIVHDFERLTLGLLLTEAAALSAEPAQPAPELFAALLEALTELDPHSGEPPLSAACSGVRRLLAVSGYEPTIESDLLRPWPADQPKPACFWIDRESATVHGRGAMPREEPRWPLAVPPNAPRFPLPPTAVRFLYEHTRGHKAPPLEAGHALQLLEGLVRVFEYHLESPLRSAGFYREVFWG